MKVLIVGYGSIGKKYFQIFSPKIIFVSNIASNSALLSDHQRGKKVVKASSGNTISLAPRSAACFISSLIRFIAEAFVSFREIGPSWPPATINFLITSPLTSNQVLAHRTTSNHCYNLAPLQIDLKDKRLYDQFFK